MSGALLSSIISILRRRRIFMRLLLMFLLATFLPLFLFSIWSYRSNSRLMREKIYVSYNEMLEQISGELEQKIRKIRNDLIEISYMTEFQNVLDGFENKNARELNLAKLQITEAMSRKYAFDNIVSGILLYTPEGKHLDAYGVEVNNFNLNGEFQTQLLAELQELNGRSTFCAVNRSDEYENAFPGPDCAILAAKAVKHTKSGKILGYLLLQIDESQLSNIFLDAARSLGARILILDGDGAVISASGEDHRLVGEIFPEHETLKSLQPADNPENEFLRVTLEGEKYETLFHNLDYLDWTVYFLTEEENLRAQVFTSVGQLLKTLAVCVLFGILVTFVFTLSIVSPLRQIADGMEQFEKGNLAVVLDESGKDEITKLASQFNKMTREINVLMETEKDSEKQKRILEIQALQAQINPHFLSNTLNTVSYIAQIRKEETIHQMLNAIIELLRESMKNDDSLHPVREELEAVRNYITIQDYRLMGKFTMDTDVEEEIMGCMVPRFLLQPVIENAVIHGIEPLNRRGHILLSGFRSGDRLIFQVTDNGVGMDKAQAGKLLQESANREKNRFSGMGVSNVDKRIKLLFGPEFGLAFESEPDTYTTVTLTLPVREETGGTA